jgi:hypothetical protein
MITQVALVEAAARVVYGGQYKSQDWVSGET